MFGQKALSNSKNSKYTQENRIITTSIYWDKMEADITDFIKPCRPAKGSRRVQYGKIPPKEVTMIPWENYLHRLDRFTHNH